MLALAAGAAAPRRRGARRAGVAMPAELVAANAVADASAAGAAHTAAKASAAGVGAEVAGASVDFGASAQAQVGEEMSDSASFDPALQVGVTQPLGYFDPLGFCRTGDKAGFRLARVAELKHGRVAMLASAGAVVQHFVKFPLPGFDDPMLAKGLGAVFCPPASFGCGVLFVLAGVLELFVWTDDLSREPGDFGDPWGVGQYTTDMRNKELNNGRVAMFTALGIIAAEIQTGKDAVEQVGFPGGSLSGPLA